MEKNDQIRKWIQKIGTDRFVLLIFLGILLTAFSKSEPKETKIISKEVSLEEGGSENDRAADEKDLPLSDSRLYCREYAGELEQFIVCMEGVEKARVFLTVSKMDTRQYERNTPYESRQEKSAEGDVRVENMQINSDSQIVFYENEDGKKVPIVSKEIPPEIQGVVVLVKCNDFVNTQKKIVSYLEALFGLNAHKIKIGKYST